MANTRSCLSAFRDQRQVDREGRNAGRTGGEKPLREVIESPATCKPLIRIWYTVIYPVTFETKVGFHDNSAS
jgi:hypothetical protein